MTNQVNQAFEKWYQSKIDEANVNNDMDMRHELNRNKSRYKYGYQAATQISEIEINSLKERVAELQSHLSNQVIEVTLNDITLEAYASKITELQADNNRLREALEVCKYDCHTGEVIGIAEKALKATQSCEML